ncbi:MAG TPA: NUDIX domain-containing protein [Spirochaetia bacterium]|jgi:8-oxo-dGTP pyrophosphatase MutT (NUDIX family)|nr:NUDIX domain-containing protein [Spirochaetia bacterium]
MTKTVACGAVIYRKHRGQVLFLLLKHANGGHWSLAKGHVESGETEVQTALREIDEETGLSVKLRAGFRETIRYSPSPSIEKTVIFFLGKAKSKKLKLQKSEILNAVWLELDDALHLVTHKDTAEVLRRALGYLTD